MLENRLSDIQLRAKLEEMVFNDLLGPASGKVEELDERTVRDRYLVGVLAPGRQGVPAASEEPDDEEIPMIPDELPEGGADSLDDGSAEQDVSVVQSHFPSSFGLTFCVTASAPELDVEACWGQYLREKREDLVDERTGHAKRIWKRYPRGGSKRIPLQDGVIRPFTVDSEAPDVRVQGQVRKHGNHVFVTLFLVNGQEEGRPKDQSHLFQPVLTVTSPDGRAIFEKKLDLPRGQNADAAAKLEEDTIEMLYRRHVEFAVGHGVSVHANVSSETSTRATLVRTRVVPRHEVPRSTPPTVGDAEQNPAFGLLEGLVLDMKELAEAECDLLQKKLTPIVTAYQAWIDAEEAKLDDPSEGLSPYREAAQATIANCRKTLLRIQDGLQLIQGDPKACEAFQFMNRAMWLQRTHSIYSEQVRRGATPDFDRDVDVPANRSWYPFQIAFILLDLPGVTQVDHPDRSQNQQAIADLLFFPTGGGKTEAYLGLTAYTMGLRRLQGAVAGRSGENGIAVLMRYTLRLLTIQQFQRATALICACESIRRKTLEQGDQRWGLTPFRIGLWVGRRTTPNRTDDAVEAIKQARGNQWGGAAGVGTPYQLTACPWCGSQIDPGKHLDAKTFKQGSCRTITYCGDKFGQCLFSKRQAPEEGLPVVVVDEEIYRRLPTVLIATVDKFAQMPWKGEVQMLFGQVHGRCERHGFTAPQVEDLQPGSRHPAKPGLKSADIVEHAPLRPPDLIIQDELHLISGPLGTLVGLYETAIDRLCGWEVDGRLVRPKVIASTATIKNADAQVHRLFLRKVNLFPPHGLDVRDNFFSLQREPSECDPGRVYLGICAPGRRIKGALIRVYVAFLCAAQALYEAHGRSVDPWLSLVGYFNSMRELGGMRRLVDDDVYTRCRKMDRRGLAKRYFSTGYLAELTSRMRSEDIPLTLDRLEAPFDPELEARRKDKLKRKDFKDLPKQPLDVLLATNMISVGVDVRRLGLMIVAGQPKATAEYIQATSRVGRNKPGIVCTVYNWARPRDLSHYETFEHYHATFYKHVEPLSITPFSAGALSRGLAGLLVGLVRLRGMEFNSNESAAKIQVGDPYVQDAIDLIAQRAALIGDGPEVGDECRAELQSKIDLWRAEAQNVTGGRTLTYTEHRGAARGTAVNLLHHSGAGRWQEFTCLDSLRDVEPTAKLVIDDHGLDEVVQAAGERTEGRESQS